MSLSKPVFEACPWKVIPPSRRNHKRRRGNEFRPPPRTPSGHIDLDNVDPVALMLLYGDSWLINRRLRAMYGGAQSLELGPHGAPNYIADMSPHIVDQGEFVVPRYHTKIRVQNHSRGGIKFADVLADHGTVATWVYRRPVTTLFHVGGCDVAGPILDNVAHQDVHWFFDKVVELVRFYRQHGLVYCADDDARHFVRLAPLCVTYLPDWGLSWKPLSTNYPTPQVVRYHRNRLNHYIKRQVGYLWNEHRVVMVNLTQNNPERDGVHLDGQSLIAFSTMIKRLVARHCCKNCRINFWVVGHSTRAHIREISRCLMTSPSCERPEGAPVAPLP